MADEDNLDEQLSEEVTERFKQQVEALSPAEAKLAKTEINAPFAKTGVPPANSCTRWTTLLALVSNAAART